MYLCIMDIQMKHKKVCGIYCIKNKNNGKIYIGSSKDIYYRLHRHKCDLLKNRHGNPYLQNSFNKHGAKAFEAKVIEECNEVDLRNREVYNVKTLKADYNLIIDIERHILPPESKKKISNTLKRKYASGEISTYKQEHRWKTVYVWDLQGNYIGEYDSPKIAADSLNINYNNVWTHLNKSNSKRVRGYIMSYNKKNNEKN